MQPTARVSSYSLQSRLLLAFSILLFVFLGFTGVVLDRAFVASVEAGAAERLQVQIYLLLAAAEYQDGEFYFLEDLQEDRFGILNSGLYGFISSSSTGEMWRSPSARTFTPPNSDFLRESVAVGETIFEVMSSNDVDYFRLSYGILWEDGISEWSFTVIEDGEPYYSEISNFRNDLWFWLGGVAVLLLLIQLLLLRWGLSPLSRMAESLKRIESGESDMLQGTYPQELQGVTDNLNLLIESERKQQERYRTTLGDLAHSLKTPLAVISGLLADLQRGESGDQSDAVNPKLETVSEQLERMNQIITYQLQRAVQSNQASTLARQVEIARVLDKVLKALQKVYADKNIEVDTRLAANALFMGDERDLLELLGNVLDNAFKYGRSRIRITVGESDNGETILEIEDDGEGIATNQREYVLQRGARADTLASGQGIGLAVVTDIVASYDGEISVGESDLGGAAIRILFKPLKAESRRQLRTRS
jgi:two-component system sensor histidine kinase PhoQ